MEFDRTTLSARRKRPWRLLCAFSLGLIALPATILVAEEHSGQPAAINASTNAVHSTSCEAGVGAAKQQALSSTAASAAPRPVRATPPSPAPPGMVWIPAGEFWMGSDEPKFTDARPWHRVRLSGYWIDKNLVTNAQFARFVAATHYVTVAERKPKAEDFPNAPPEVLVPGSIVFTPPSHPVPLDNGMQWWSYVPGANWRHPQGPSSTIKGRENYPVVHIAYEDAEAYAKWARKRLPTEAEFEYAERGGLDRAPYAWGKGFTPGGKYMANTFQGHFPEKDTGADGHIGISPVGSYKANGYGLYDMSGNVWEWTSDWYRPDYYKMLAANGPVAGNPKGPEDSIDPSEPGVPKKVHRGGSFLCSDQYCSRYMPGGRGKGEPSTGTNHLGFRLVKDAGPAISRGMTTGHWK
ncbi:MAG: formylglycine-generating enzyme family protein [Candidatus Sulfotelmatobacter sp.]